jgi:hypothetical protein
MSTTRTECGVILGIKVEVGFLKCIPTIPIYRGKNLQRERI